MQFGEAARVLQMDVAIVEGKRELTGGLHDAKTRPDRQCSGQSSQNDVKERSLEIARCDAMAILRSTSSPASR